VGVTNANAVCCSTLTCATWREIPFPQEYVIGIAIDSRVPMRHAGMYWHLGFAFRLLVTASLLIAARTAQADDVLIKVG
jgi:hypothetical protein